MGESKPTEVLSTFAWICQSFHYYLTHNKSWKLSLTRFFLHIFFPWRVDWCEKQFREQCDSLVFIGVFADKFKVLRFIPGICMVEEKNQFLHAVLWLPHAFMPPHTNTHKGISVQKHFKEELFGLDRCWEVGVRWVLSCRDGV